MTQLYLALGSNVGDSQRYIADAIQSLEKVLTNIKQSPIYTSKAVGYTDQADFLNTAISGETDLSPIEVLNLTDSIEKKLGRIERFKWGPREIDIDIIFYGDKILDTPKLTIPHPRLAEREFVLQPICDLNPDFTDPVSHLTMSELLSKLPDSDKSIMSRLDPTA